MRLKLTQSPTKVGVEVGTELGNTFCASYFLLVSLIVCNIHQRVPDLLPCLLLVSGGGEVVHRLGHRAQHIVAQVT